MKLFIAVHWEGTQAIAAAVGFEAWDAAEATKTYRSRIVHAETVERGQPDLRAVHCVMQLLVEHRLAPELLLIEGFVHLDAADRPGVGQHLFQALGGKVPVVGVSKKGLVGLPAQCEVMREDEAPPLFITSIGVDIGAAKARVRSMHGRKRVPTLMKLAARLAKHMD